MKNNDKIILKKILEYCHDLEESLESEEHFFNDKMYRYGCCMCIFQIGELCKRLSDDLKEEEPDIPWQNWCGIRDIFAHQYEKVQFEIVWYSIEDDLPTLKKVCERLLSQK